jgi:hypothetical protein
MVPQKKKKGKKIPFEELFGGLKASPKAVRYFLRV